MTLKPTFPPLKGLKDYSLWSIRAESYLISLELIGPIIDLFEARDSQNEIVSISNLSVSSDLEIRAKLILANKE